MTCGRFGLNRFSNLLRFQSYPVFGHYDGQIGLVAWYNSNFKNKTYPVAQKQQNSYDLYDVLGNVWEWCQDSDRGHGRLRGKKRVVRGGSYGCSDKKVPSAFRARWRTALDLSPA